MYTYEDDPQKVSKDIKVQKNNIYKEVRLTVD